MFFQKTDTGGIDMKQYLFVAAVAALLLAFTGCTPAESDLL